MKIVRLIVPFVLVAAVCAMAIAAEGKATLKGKVTYGGEAVKGVAVSLDGPGGSKSAETNDKGEFSFSELLAGDYKLVAEGIAKNTKRKAEKTVKVPEPPATADPLEIKFK